MTLLYMRLTLLFSRDNSVRKYAHFYPSLLLLLLLNTFVLSSSALAEPAEPESQNGILIVGDSLSAAYGINESEGWVNLLRNKLKNQDFNYPVINASISGDTSSSGKRRLKPLLDRWQPAIVIIELGGNDGLRGVQPRLIESNLAAMIEQSLFASAEVILVGMHIPPNYGPRYTKAFHQLYNTLAENYSISLLPFLLEGVARNRSLMQSDGIHPTAKAQPIILANIWPRIAPLLSTE